MAQNCSNSAGYSLRAMRRICSTVLLWRLGLGDWSAMGAGSAGGVSLAAATSAFAGSSSEEKLEDGTDVDSIESTRGGLKARWEAACCELSTGSAAGVRAYM